MAKQVIDLSPIVKVAEDKKLFQMLNEEIRDCIDMLEGYGHSYNTNYVMLFGKIEAYEDGTKVFSWKEKKCIVMRIVGRDGDEVEIEIERHYL